jgi:transposase
MPRPRIDMRKIREVLRLALGEELSRRQVSAASGVPLTTVSDYLRRAASAGLKWPLRGRFRIGPGCTRRCGARA